MATLQNIRNKGPLLVIVIGIALLAFVMGDLFSSGSMLLGKARDRAFVVNGEVIGTQQYAEKIAEFEEFQKMLIGRSSLDENSSLQIREAVFQQMVHHKLVENQAKKIGLVVTKEEINDLVHGESISPILQQLPFFRDPETGIFSRQTLMEFLNVINSSSFDPQEQAMVSQYRSMWLFIENLIKTQRLEEKYISLFSNMFTVSDLEASKSLDLSRRNADIAYVMQSYSAIPDSAVTVNDREVKAYYDKNKKTYALDAPLVKISYFTKEIKPDDEDFAEVEAESQKAFDQLTVAANPATVVADYSNSPYRDVFVAEDLLTEPQLDFLRTASLNDIFGPVLEENEYQIYKLIDKTRRPDSLHLSVLALPLSASLEQDSIMVQLADSIYNVICGGELFADVANSLNPGSNGGDIGWVREIDLIQVGSEMVESAFGAPVGVPIKISLSNQLLIFQVEERTAPVNKYKLAVINMPVTPSEKTSNNIDNELNKLVSHPEVQKRFNELAVEAGYRPLPNVAFSANDFSVDQIPGTRQIITWAANQKKKNIGSVRKFDLTNLRIVARVEEVIPAGTTPLSELYDFIHAQLIDKKKAEKIIADLEQQNVSSLETYAALMDSEIDSVQYVNFGTQNITGLGFEPVINAVSSFAPLNSIVGPMEANMGVCVAKVVSREEVATLYTLEEEKKVIMENNSYRFQGQAIEVLKNKLIVEDNRYRFF